MVVAEAVACSAAQAGMPPLVEGLPQRGWPRRLPCYSCKEGLRMATTTSNSQNVTLAASTEQHVTWNEWFEFIAITNLGTTAVWVCTDGSTATVGETGADVVLPGAVATFPNRQPLPNADVPGTVYSSGPGIGWQAQKGYAGTNLTYVSLISSGTPQVVVSPQ